MSQKRAKTKNDDVVEEVDRLTLLRRAVVTLGVLLLIAYITLLLTSRTDGFRYVVQERLVERWQTELQVDRAWLAADLTLHIEGIHTEPFGTQRVGPGFSIQALKVEWNKPGWFWPGLSRVRGGAVHGGTWSFQQDANGTWMPQAFFADAAWLTRQAGLRFSDEEVAAEHLSDAARNISLHQTELLFWDANAAPYASVSGLDFARDRATLLGRDVLYQHLTAESAQWQQHRLVNIDQARLRIDGVDVPLPASDIKVP